MLCDRRSCASTPFPASRYAQRSQSPWIGFSRARNREFLSSVGSKLRATCQRYLVRGVCQPECYQPGELSDGKCSPVSQSVPQIGPDCPNCPSSEQTPLV